MLVDLDQEFDCAPLLGKDWLPTPAQYMQFRVVVPQIEAWLLADRERFAFSCVLARRGFSITRRTLPLSSAMIATLRLTISGSGSRRLTSVALTRPLTTSSTTSCSESVTK